MEDPEKQSWIQSIYSFFSDLSKKREIKINNRFNSMTEKEKFFYKKSIQTYCFTLLVINDYNAYSIKITDSYLHQFMKQSNLISRLHF